MVFGAYGCQYEEDIADANRTIVVGIRGIETRQRDPLASLSPPQAALPRTSRLAIQIINVHRARILIRGLLENIL